MYPVDLLKVRGQEKIYPDFFIIAARALLTDISRLECRFYIRRRAGFIRVSRMRCLPSIELKAGGRCGRVCRV